MTALTYNTVLLEKAQHWHPNIDAVSIETGMAVSAALIRISVKTNGPSPDQINLSSIEPSGRIHRHLTTPCIILADSTRICRATRSVSQISTRVRLCAGLRRQPLSQTQSTTIATRNTKDFEESGGDAIDPQAQKKHRNIPHRQRRHLKRRFTDGASN